MSALLEDIPDDEDWRLDALCPQVDSEIFFPDKGGSTHQAKLICRQCPVKDECLAYALENGERFGIWGGLTTKERNKLPNRKRKPIMIQPCGTPAGYQRHYRNHEKPCNACRQANLIVAAERRRSS